MAEARRRRLLNDRDQDDDTIAPEGEKMKKSILLLIDLPVELLIMIFQLLPQSQLADLATSEDINNNGTIRDVCKDGSLWRSVFVPAAPSSEEKGYDSDNSMCDFVGKSEGDTWDTITAGKVIDVAGEHLRKLRISSRPDDSNALSIRALQHCPNLERLKLFRVQNISPDLLSEIGRSGSSLTHLVIFGTPLDPEVLAQNASSLRRLKKIRLSLYLGKKMLTSIAQNCPVLEDFRFSHHIAVGEDAFFRDFFVQIGKTIKSLNVRDVSDESYITLAQSCHLLETLEVGDFSRRLAIDGLKSILGLPDLKKLYLAQGSLSGKDFVEALKGRRLNKLMSLTLISFPFLNDDGVIAISTSCPNLEEIELSWCKLVGDPAVRSILSQCTKLKRLRLRTISTEKSLITRAGFAGQTRCPDLKRIWVDKRLAKTLVGQGCKAAI